ncbi:ABC transporter ATP-binding protein [Vitiosangium sp. GDMCC 1.1324]|uniref:ABC transporter ATP-binding protein n=1 Tax=Vitiosangium sp. (strain GDMCC 1.1324) TaxID=2138576 RepID=UPI000D350C0E|nr:ABC transporter ATP-binding protein [Vitiosangium sp. GDMCC 1.1324]PTL75861.1 multidrug ABC transporter ATP-binding protein [Vitiosangium sp. GDMCC 1.1324]
MLTISRLSKTYANGVRALDGVSLTIGSGLFGLLGPNGAGKSTLMRTIAALQEPDEGEILFDGRNIIQEPQHVRHQLGYLPQDFGVYPGVSAVHLLDHLAVLKGITHRGERADQVDALLHLTNLHDVRKKDVSTFSGGMKQRFGIAQALLGSPRLIIVDEPTAGLDPEERNRFHNLLSEVGENVVVILSTHIVEDVRDLCPRMAILVGGRILLEGDPTRLIDQLEGRLWRKTVTKAELEEYRSAQRVLSAHHFGGRIRVHIQSEESPGPGFERIPPDLEDVYFSSLADQRTRRGAVTC